MNNIGDVPVMTQLTEAQRGNITPEMIHVAEREGMEPETLRELIALGKVVIPKNRGRKYDPVGVGKGLKTKVNANIGTSPRRLDLNEELEKLRVAVEAPAALYAPEPDRGAVTAAASGVGVPEGARWFTYVGGFNPHKNVDAIGRAPAMLTHEMVEAPPHRVPA